MKRYYVGPVLFLVVCVGYALSGWPPTAFAQSKVAKAVSKTAVEPQLIILDQGGPKGTAVIQVKGLNPVKKGSAKIGVWTNPTSVGKPSADLTEMTFRGRKIRVIADLAKGCGEVHYFPEDLNRVVVIAVPRGTVITQAMLEQ